MIRRNLTLHVQQSAQWFPVVAVLGPRQSGKTTLVQTVFSKHAYVSLEDLNMRDLALRDPRAFLYDFANEQGLILDEIQHVPELLSYIQTSVDKEKKNGFYIITGSQNLLVNQAVSQSLAGRVGILTLMPLSIDELEHARLLPQTIEEALFTGGYPRAYVSSVPPSKLYQNYIRTYVERDVRQLKNIGDLATFQRFLQLCAGRIGQVLNYESLGNDCGIDSKTVRSWLSILEATYVIFLLQPYYKNFGKRLIKSPKLYFVDTGLACSLLRLRDAQDVADHYMRGNLVESFIISDAAKQYYNRDDTPPLYFWRDVRGNEIDLVVEHAGGIVPVEIKAGKTVSSSYFKGIDYLRELAGAGKSFVIYAGDTNQVYGQSQLMGWKSARTLVKNIEE